GYNTDVRHRGLVFHVQTEDKGLQNPCVESLVYVGGQILTRRQSEYARLLKEGEGKEAIASLMERQHRRTIAAIRAGKFDEHVTERLGPLAGAPAPVGGAAAEVSDPSARTDASRSLDQVILDYLSTEAEQEHLVLMMDSPDELNLGTDVLLAFHAKSSLGGRPIEAAEVAVKLISTESEPVVLGSGATNEHGKLHLQVQVPDLRRGTAALIVTATSAVGTAEIKHLI
ncbi:MAG: hypothetical protein OEM62_01465, partial [Acidobacteriota bacterium]|nr:hypothetical protein [Acidobacteriota bacterium]